jgi:hypothetical protein
VPERVVDGAVQWWARQIRRHLTDPLATVPALAELREGEAEGAELAGERVWEAYDWHVDRLPFVHRREAKRVTIAADANELEQGIAAAAVEIRKKGLPPGQP